MVMRERFVVSPMRGLLNDQVCYGYAKGLNMCKFGTMRKAAAGIVAAAMLSVGAAGLVSTANAAEIDNNDITITQPAAVPNQLIQPTMNGRTFKAYRISNYSNAQVNASGQITGYDMKAQAPFTDALIKDAVKAAVVTGDAVNTNFTNVVELNADGSITFKGDAENLTALQFVGKYFYGTGADVYGNDNANSHQVRTFADYLLKHLPQGANAISATGANDQVTLDIPDGEEGLYLIIEEPTIDTKTDAFKGETVSRAMLTGTPIKVGDKLYNEVVNDGGKTYTLGTLALKAEKVTLTKEIEGKDQLIQLNSVRTFTIRTNVPNYTTDYPNWQAKNFTIADNPSANINPFVTEGDNTTVKTLKVEATKADGTKATLAIGTDYTVDVTNSNSTDANDFKISLTDPTKWSGQGITITYDGVLTSTTPDGTTNTDQATVNDVQLDFSNNPNDPNEKATLTDQEKLFNAQLDMEKVAFNDVVKKLAGAKFEATVGGAPVAFTKSADGLTYTVNKDTTATGVTNEVVFGVQKEDGIKPITLDGLAGDTDQAVTYTFTETKAPEGYILGDNPVSFTVTVTPTFDAAGESTGAEVVVNSANHKNFIDLSEVANATSPASTNGTVYTLGTARVENTKNISDFAKTGGEIVWLMAAAGAAAAAGVGLGIVVRRSRSRRYRA